MTTKEITIGGAIVAVNQPYAEGQTITAAEAKSLNQTRAENIANNCRKFVTERNAGDAKNPQFTDEQLSEIAAHVTEYDAGYEFTLASVGGGRKPVDPLEKEATSIARDIVTGKIKDAGGMVKDYAKDQLAAAIAKVAENPAVIKAAKARIKQRESLADIELEAIGG